MVHSWILYPIFGYNDNLFEHIRNLDSSQAGNRAIFTCRGLKIWGKNGVFWFDFHSQNTEGFLDPSGSAGLLEFRLIRSPNNFSKRFYQTTGSKHRLQVSCYRLQVIAYMLINRPIRALHGMVSLLEVFNRTYCWFILLTDKTAFKNVKKYKLLWINVRKVYHGESLLISAGRTKSYITDFFFYTSYSRFSWSDYLERFKCNAFEQVRKIESHTTTILIQPFYSQHQHIGDFICPMH